MKPYVLFLHEYLYFQVHFGVNLRFHNQFFCMHIKSNTHTIIISINTNKNKRLAGRYKF